MRVIEAKTDAEFAEAVENADREVALLHVRLDDAGIEHSTQTFFDSEIPMPGDLALDADGKWSVCMRADIFPLVSKTTDERVDVAMCELARVAQRSGAGRATRN